MAESEKYAHVTYFFNGGYSKKVNGEEYYGINSPNVSSYDKTPSMKSSHLTNKILEYSDNNKYDFTFVNFAAPDMVGHTGNLKAGIKCCEKLDESLREICKRYLKKDGTVIITADHGNIEEMIAPKTGRVETRHSTNRVPLVIINKHLQGIELKKNGKLGDIAPTILNLLDLPKPSKMSGNNLIKKI